MAGTLKIKITECSGEIKDLRYAYMWSAWLDGRLLGQGHAFRPEEAESKAMNLVTDLVSPDEVEHIEITQA
ncbi:MAG: hypothetical protein M5U22_07220 [Thermoleophilia bacterium]|nr:hypothetical protein [Thermoleophilia bacterium]